jgi:adenylate kinase family enzyme
MRVHILGASGSGTTTLGIALAAELGADHVDTDDYYWEPTDPPFQHPRPRARRLKRLGARLDRSRAWVLSGSLCGWGDPLIGRFELAVFLWVPTEVRLARLRARELAQFGADAIAPGGAMHASYLAFLDWARAYDVGDLSMRSLARHRNWLEDLPCPVLRLEGEVALETQLVRVREALGSG